MLQKLPNTTLYRKRNCWAPKKIYKNAKRVDKSKDICLLDNLSEKYFLIMVIFLLFSTIMKNCQGANHTYCSMKSFWLAC